MIGAVFDVDRTLLPRTTAERIFLRFLIHERVIGLRSLLETVRFLAVEGRSSPIRAVRQHRPYLRGQPVPAMFELGRRCFDEVILPRLSPRGVAELEAHERQGHATVLLSGSLPFILQPMASALDVDYLICSRLDVRDQRLTGHLMGLHPQGRAKALLVRRLAGERAIDLDRSFCYADHHTDQSLLELFGHPICVNPTERLRAIAGQRDWAIEWFA